jgi:hypothetical protein
MKKRNPKDIRDDFLRRFETLAQAANLQISNLCPWPHPLPLEDTLLARWQSEDLMKVMRLQEADADEILQFGYAIGKSGIDYEYDDLLIEAMDTNEKAEVIFEIYKLWFIENKSPAEMESLLAPYDKQLNPPKWYLFLRRWF